MLEMTQNWLQQHAGLARTLLMLFLLMALLPLESRYPHRAISGRLGRFVRNLSISAIASGMAALLALALPFLSALGAAQLAASLQIGLLAQIDMPFLLKLMLCLLLLDLAMYWQHRLMHMLPWLWRLHRVHHADIEFDVSLGLRFHPFEIIVSMLYKALVVLMLGAPVIAVVLYEMTLMAMSLFTHVNVSLRQRWRPLVESVFVTPDLHRVHHSIALQDTQSNFANFLSIWDRVFKSFAPARTDSASMPIGLPEFRSAEDQKLISALTMPLLGPKKND